MGILAFGSVRGSLVPGSIVFGSMALGSITVGSLALGWAALPAATAQEVDLSDRAGTQWRPYLEWRLENPTADGDPFDLVASATFRHAVAGDVPAGEAARGGVETHTTPMFYDGAGAWRFRFTGTRPGVWTFETSSEDPDLHGRRGRVTIAPSPDPEAHGFLTSFGDKWGWQGTDRAFVPQLVMYSGDPESYRDAEQVDRDIRTFLVEHGFSGFHVPTIAGRWFDHRSEDLEVTGSMVDPDPRTFENLELLITRVHAAGGHVHIWAWGDDQRRQTPMRLRGGPDGAEARRLERYLAARLGPLPGWSMGFGFDLQEWAADPGRVNLVRPWHDRMERLLGWRHLLGGRMGPTILGSSTDHSAQARLNEGLGYVGFEHHRPTHDVYVAALAAAAGRPVLSEDRFRIRVPPLYPDKDYDEELTRRGLYHSTLAGGVANIWGNNHPGGWGPGGGSRPYPHPEWIQTYATFFRDRFTKDMSADRGAGGADGAPRLRRPTGRHIVLYLERSSAVPLELDLSDLVESEPAVAVDTKRPYREVPMGMLEPGKTTWTAPHASDWVIAVGVFRREDR